MMPSVVMKTALLFGCLAGWQAQGTKPPDETAPGYERSPDIYPSRK